MPCRSSAAAARRGGSAGSSCRAHVAVFALLGAGNYGAHTTLIHWGGYTGLAAAACAFYLALAELCEFSYGRAVLPVWSLAKR